MPSYRCVHCTDGHPTGIQSVLVALSGRVSLLLANPARLQQASRNLYPLAGSRRVSTQLAPAGEVVRTVCRRRRSSGPSCFRPHFLRPQGGPQLVGLIAFLPWEYEHLQQVLEWFCQPLTPSASGSTLRGGGLVWRCSSSYVPL